MKKLIITVLVFAALYTVVGFLVFPVAIERGITARGVSGDGRGVSVEAVRVNPYTLTVTLEGLSLNAGEAGPNLDVRRTVAKFNLLGLPGHNWSLRELVLDQPQLSIRARDSRAHFKLLVDSLLGADERGGRVIQVSQLVVNKGELRLSAPTSGDDRDQPAWWFSDVRLQVKNLSTAPGQPGEFSLTSTLGDSARLTSNGFLALNEREVDATVGVAGFDLTTLGPYYHVLPAAQIASGTLSADLKLLYENDRFIVGGGFELEQVDIEDETTRAQVFSAERVTGTGLSIAAEPFRARLAQAHLINAGLQLTLNPLAARNPLHWLCAGNDTVPEIVNAVGKVAITNGRISFTDSRASPPLQLSADNINGEIMKSAEAGDSYASVVLEARLDNSGSAKLTGGLAPCQPKQSSDLSLELGNLDASVFSRYTVLLSGQTIESGRVSANVHWLAKNNTFKLDNEVTIDALRMSEPRQFADSGQMSLDLALAVLTDPDYRINVSIPVAGGPLGAGFDLVTHAGKSVRQYLNDIVASPFTVIGALVNETDEALQLIEFEPGSAALTESATNQLGRLHTALQLRPAVELNVTPRYHVNADRNTLSRQQMLLHIALATGSAANRFSGGSAGSSTSPPDFSDPKVQSVVDEFAVSRLSAKDLAELGVRHPDKNIGYYESAFEALIASEQVSTSALQRLARYRAQTVVNALTSAGTDARRLRITDQVATIDGKNEEPAVKLALDHCMFATAETLDGQQGTGGSSLCMQRQPADSSRRDPD